MPCNMRRSGFQSGDVLHHGCPDKTVFFLLCSDGLSDYERVSSVETEIYHPDGKVDVAAGARLVEIANTQNGHDNVTVGLLHATTV